jgi:transcriptional regulator with XRE-family HTH domain
MPEESKAKNLKKLLGRRIAYLRKGAGLSQAQLAEKLEVCNNFIGQIERGERAPSLCTLEKFARIFNVRVKDLFDFDEPKTRKKLDDRDKKIDGLVLFLRTKKEEEIIFINKLVRILYKQFKDARE